ncbi:putative pentatricopeptide repeat-containing protein At1g56570 [Aristolochia californica]|uniref:putative pentatricopeptide repeat-containing protein At1g56570 n=1 Tax=Aristolochia californica TaxID=171875 RepID=UPI0035DBFF5E
MSCSNRISSLPAVKNSVKVFYFNTQPKPAPFVASKLIKAYSEHGLLEEARRLLDEVPDRDVVTWTAMISGYTSNGLHDLAWAGFCEMRREGVGPNAYTISNVLKACKGMELHLHGTGVHGLAIKSGIDGSMYVENALVDLYATCSRSLDDACNIFERMEEKTPVSWTTMIAGYTRWGEGYEGIRAFQRMLQDGTELNPFNCSIAIKACASVESVFLGKQIHAAATTSGLDSNLIVANSLVDMYCRCMSLSEAKQYFDRMRNRDLVSWNTIISGFGRYSFHESLQLFSEMAVHDMKPNCFTFTSITASCGDLAVLHCGQQVHGGIIRRGFCSNLPLGNALIDMYAKCGSIVDSYGVFNEMDQRDLLSWTSMLIGYGNHGYGREAIDLFNDMLHLGFRPDQVALLSVLSACSHAGLVDEGMKYFKSVGDYDISLNQDIYGCVVDLLGRGGRIKEAYELIQSMPFKPDESVWGALLGACKAHRVKELGILAANKIFDLRPKGAGTYIILSNIYAAEGKWDEFAKTRRMLRGMGSKKEAGRSWIEVRNQVYSFVVSERISSHMELVYGELERLLEHLRDAGYVPDLNCVDDSEDGT